MHWTAGALRNNCTQENCTNDPAFLTKCTQEQALEHLHLNTPRKAPRPLKIPNRKVYNYNIDIAIVKLGLDKFSTRVF